MITHVQSKINKTLSKILVKYIKLFTLFLELIKIPFFSKLINSLLNKINNLDSFLIVNLLKNFKELKFNDSLYSYKPK